MSTHLSEALNAPISTLGSRKPVSVPVGSRLAAAIDAMRSHHIGCVLVTDVAGKLAGLITERDLVTRVFGQAVDVDREPVEHYMTAEPETLKRQDPLAFALNRMSLGGYRHVPLVTHDGRPDGIVSVKDLVDFIVEQFPDQVFNLPPEPDVHPTTREGA